LNQKNSLFATNSAALNYVNARTGTDVELGKVNIVKLNHLIIGHLNM